MGDLYLLFLQTCKGITFIEKFDLTNNVYLMSDKDILCESLSTLLQYTQYFDSMRSNSPSKNQIRFLQIFQLSYILQFSQFSQKLHYWSGSS